MFRKQSNANSTDEESESPWISFTDLMSGFLIVILLALAAAIIMLTIERASLRQQKEEVEAQLVKANQAGDEANQAKADAIAISREFISLFEELRTSQLDIDATVRKMDDYDRARFELLNEIQKGLADKKIRVEVSRTGDVIHISEDNLNFDLGKYDIADRFKPTMQAIGSEVSKRLQSPAGSIIDTVFVEGHTDNVPNSREMGNWGLSSYRAISLWQFWNACPAPAGQLPNLKNADQQAMFSVTGYGETRPLKVFPPGSSEDQRINRRIDLRFNLQTAKKNLLTELSGKVSESVERFDKAYIDLKKRLETISDDGQAK